MKIIGHSGSEYLAQISEDEIAVLLGFRSTYDDAYKAWKSRVVQFDTGGMLAPGTKIEVREIAAFWQGIIWKEDEAKKTASTLRALADLITTNLPSGIVPPAPPAEEPAK